MCHVRRGTTNTWGFNEDLDDRAANVWFDTKEHLEIVEVGGVIDIRFAASANTSFAPMIGAKLHGVRKAVATRFSNVPLEKISLPIRVSSDFNGSAHQPVVVVRDEAGNIDFTEKLAATARA